MDTFSRFEYKYKHRHEQVTQIASVIYETKYSRMDQVKFFTIFTNFAWSILEYFVLYRRHYTNKVVQK